jgi:uncharacterized membrane protein (Fun14 family)
VVFQIVPARAHSGGLRRLSPTALESSAGFRFGTSFAGGFIIGWLFKRSLRLAIIAAGVIFALIALARWTGWWQLDWDTLSQSFRDSLACVRGELAAFEKVLLGWLPSAVAGAVGAFKGLRWR